MADKEIKLAMQEDEAVAPINVVPSGSGIRLYLQYYFIVRMLYQMQRFPAVVIPAYLPRMQEDAPEQSQVYVDLSHGN